MKRKNENKDMFHYKRIKFILLKWAQTTSEIIFTLELPSNDLTSLQPPHTHI